MNALVIGSIVFALLFIFLILSALIISTFLKRKTNYIKYDPTTDSLMPTKDSFVGGDTSYTVDEQQMKTLAKRLTSTGWVLHSKPTCPWCVRQIDMFGHSAKYLNIRECDEGCEGIHLYPTWTNGERQEPGTRSIESLRGLLDNSDPS